MRMLPLVVLALALSAPPAWADTMFVTPLVPLVGGDGSAPPIPTFPDPTLLPDLGAGVSLMMQSFPTFLDSGGFGDPTAGSIPQPGTVGFTGEGTGSGRLHPFTGQEFGSQMAVLSWNTLMALVASSTPGEPGMTGIGYFDPGQPFRTDGCSFARPQSCFAVQDLNAVPEPGAFLLFALGFAAVGLGTRRR